MLIAETVLGAVGELFEFFGPLEAAFLMLIALLLGIWNRASKAIRRSTELAVWLFRLGRELHPGLTLGDVKHRLRILSLWISSQRELRAWHGIRDNPKLAMALRRFPQMHGVVCWPYINYRWSMQHRLQAVDRHYRLLDGRAAIIAAASQADVELVKLDDQYPGLRLVLDRAIWFLREGEIVLNLFLRDQRLKSIAFTLGHESRQRVAYVGAIQGSNSRDALHIYRDITHALHGMRPRDFLVVTLKLLCNELRIAKIYAVSDDARQHQSRYFSGSHKDKVLLKYDEVWAEHGGTRLDNGFFEIPVMIKYRAASETPTRKRATYRRRYEMLDKVALGIKAACSQHEAACQNSRALVE